ncbi:MAG: hypothetical protein ACI9N3_003003 [Colwellia sp.]
MFVCLFVMIIDTKPLGKKKATQSGFLLLRYKRVPLLKLIFDTRG